MFRSLLRRFAATLVAAALVFATVGTFADDGLNPQPLPPSPPPSLDLLT